MPKKIFISYAHESEELSNKVLEFSNYLRSKGIDAEIDQYEESPPEGWPKWMMRQIQEADSVLICCSKLFYNRANDFSGSDDGLGVKWETNLILQELYVNNSNNTKFIPILISENNKKHIPLPLQPYTYYDISKESKKEQLIQRLLGINKSKRPPLGKEEEFTKEKPPLDLKERKSMFFSSIIDLDLWNRARWSGMAFASDPSLREPPIVCFMFENEKTGNKIFKKLKEEFGNVDEEEEIRLSFIEDINSKKPNDYKVHFGSSINVIAKKLEKYGLEPEKSLMLMMSRIHEMNPPSNPSSLAIFKNSYNYFKHYYITNLIKKNGKIIPNTENKVLKKNVYFRTKSEVIKDKNDEDIVVFSKMESKT